MQIIYSPHYELSLPGHVWPTTKYRLVADALRRFPGFVFVEPRHVSWDDLALVHDREYLDKLRLNRLSLEELALLELPWRPELADGFRLMTGGTCEAVRIALGEGAAAHIGGGLHHAFAGHGEGFCPINDIAVAVRFAQRDMGVRRAAVIDLDVHHGNGTAMIFDGDPDVYTCSIHQQHNYPLFKPRSNLDIGLENRESDEGYLRALDRALPAVMATNPDLVVYVAGADPFEEDKLGGLAITKAGLAERDRRVVSAVRGAAVPLAVVLAGGYAFDVQDTVDVHVATIRALLSSG
jgi:acetoin utilization deacetylase AcuC-like enzyme